MKQALLVANGDPQDGDKVRQVLAEFATAAVICADGGVRVARYYKVQIDTVLGDLDSLSADEISQLESQGVSIHRYPKEKNETDLEIALKWVAGDGYQQIRIIGALGGRFDQTLANTYLLALPELTDCDVAMVAGKQLIRLLSAGTHQLTGQPDDTLSLVPLGGNVTGISTQGLYYPLKNETLHFGPARGVSNIFAGTTASVAFTSGQLLMIHTLGRA